MARQPRVYVEGLPCHVIQRGNNRQACFFDAADYEFYLECLQDAGEKYECRVHAYVLMTNHVHLLVTPGNEKSLARMMQSVGRRYVKWVNTIYKRSGTLWEGRYKCSLVDSERYLLTCYRYIEMNPVRAKMVERPEIYHWSSHRMNAGYKCDNWLDQHPIYTGLSQCKTERYAAYKMLFELDDNATWITEKSLSDTPIGDQRFLESIEQMLNIKFNRSQVGRPGIKEEGII